MSNLDKAKAIVEAITAKFSVGNASQFCDDPPEWDSATEDELVAIILPILEQ